VSRECVTIVPGAIMKALAVPGNPTRRRQLKRVCGIKMASRSNKSTLPNVFVDLLRYRIKSFSSADYGVSIVSIVSNRVPMQMGRQS